MTPSEADKRIMQSRVVLARYNLMMNAGDHPYGRMDGTVRMLHQEQDELRKIASEHPMKGPKISRLVSQWSDLITRIRESAG